MLPLKGLKHIDKQGETIVLQGPLTGERIEWSEVRFGSLDQTADAVVVRG